MNFAGSRPLFTWLQPSGMDTGALDHGGEGDVGRGIEVEHQPSRLLGLEWLAVPGVQLQRPSLRRRHQGFDAVEPDKGLSVA